MWIRLLGRRFHMNANKSQKDLFSMKNIKKDILKCRLLQLWLAAP